MNFEDIIKGLPKAYYQDSEVVIYHADCRDILPLILDKSIDLVLTDPPYGTTACSWDTIVPFKPMWNELLRVVQDDTALIFTASQPFTSLLITSNLDMFKYEWIWRKDKGANFASCKKTPMKVHENILVFGGSKYFPIMKERPLKNRRNNSSRINKSSQTGTEWLCEKSKGNLPVKYPETILEFNACREYKHPTQKPVELFKYLIKTYSLQSDLILDPFLGSGTTAFCSKKLNRKCIGIEIEEKYCEIAAKRCSQSVMKLDIP